MSPEPSREAAEDHGPAARSAPAPLLLEAVTEGWLARELRRRWLGLDEELVLF